MACVLAESTDGKERACVMKRPTNLEDVPRFSRVCVSREGNTLGFEADRFQRVLILSPQPCVCTPACSSRRSEASSEGVNLGSRRGEAEKRKSRAWFSRFLKPCLLGSGLVSLATAYGWFYRERACRRQARQARGVLWFLEILLGSVARGSGGCGNDTTRAF